MKHFKNIYYAFKHFKIKVKININRLKIYYFLELNNQKNEQSKQEEEKAELLLKAALDYDENGQLEEAIDFYTQAIEFCLKCVRIFANKQLKFPFLI